MKLQDIIKESGVKQYRFADAAGISESDFSRIVNERVEPDDEQKKAIVKAVREVIGVKTTLGDLWPGSAK